MSMKRIAFFVEGQTEQIFINKLIREILGEDKVSIISKQSIGGTNVPKQELIRKASISRKSEYYVLINDCGADNRVKSEILENLKNLTDAGYTAIIGIRDLYPLPEEDLSRLEKGLNFLPYNRIEDKKIFDIIVIVQEIETWFLAETHHFQKVDKRLNATFINKCLGFNPYAINAMERRHPSKDLNDIYQLVGKSYTKRYWQVQRLVNRLDYSNFFRNVRYDIPSFAKLMTLIEQFKE